MGIEIIPYPEALEAAVQRFNRRLVDGGKGEYVFPESHVSREFPKREDRSIWRDYFVARDDGDEVRGGYIMRGAPFYLMGKRLEIPFLKLPVSEGVVDSEYAYLALSLLMDVVKRNPLYHAMGMGGLKNRLPQIMQRMGNTVEEIPFFFRIERAARVLRMLPMMRQGKVRPLAASAAAYTGAGGVLLGIMQRPRFRPDKELNWQAETGFGDWVDEVWESAHTEYGLAAERSSKTLPLLYLPFQDKIQIIRVRRGEATIGWSVVKCTQMKNHPQFGSLKVATIADGFCKLEDVEDVIHAATNHLQSLKPDLIISNQLHKTWRGALKNAGYRKGPSNYLISLSPKAAEAMKAEGVSLTKAHLTRGDGDGPIHL